MPFRMPKKTRQFFNNIFDKKDKSGTKFKLLFDEYYFSLLAGFECGKYDQNAELEDSEFFDDYPNEYSECREYIAGLLIATEIKLQGISEDDADEMERLMVEYIDSSSKTLLTSKGEQRLNQYAARGIDVLEEQMSGRPYELDSFFREYFMFFQKDDDM